MAGNKREQVEARKNLALSIVSNFGIEKLDTMENPDRKRALRSMAKELKDHDGCTIDTAKVHIAKACRRLRNPSETSDVSWGGAREERWMD